MKETLKSKESKRFSTARTTESRPRFSRSSTATDGHSTTRTNGFIHGERVSHSAGITPLDSLYKPAYPKYPTFPSIYQTKYDHDFRYVPWPVERCKREYTPPPDYSKFKIGKSRYTEEFFPKDVVKINKTTPVSRNRVNNPHPRMRIVQNYPDSEQAKSAYFPCSTKGWKTSQVTMHRWIWSAPENVQLAHIDRTSTTAERVRKWQRNLEPQWHRWNSR